MRQKEKLDKQLKSNPDITQEIISEIPNLQYSSGRQVKIGDKILNGFINIERKFIILHLDELNTIYEEEEEYEGLEFPILSLKYK